MNERSVNRRQEKNGRQERVQECGRGKGRLGNGDRIGGSGWAIDSWKSTQAGLQGSGGLGL